MFWGYDIENLIEMVSRGYSFENLETNLPDLIQEKFDFDVMDNESSDWQDFIDNTKNLQESINEGYFYTDYGNYPVILIASSKNIENLKPSDIKPANVEALYKR